jgi:hypothetical protein
MSSLKSLYGQLIPIIPKSSHVEAIVLEVLAGREVSTRLPAADFLPLAQKAWDAAKEQSHRESYDYENVVYDRVIRATKAVHGFISVASANTEIIMTREYKTRTIVLETVIDIRNVICKDGIVTFPCYRTTERVECDRVVFIEYIGG